MINTGGRILVVDDELVTIEVMAEVLAPVHDIIFATSGAEALDLAATGKPDLILLDVMMPGMDGYEVCRHLKADSATIGIPVIFITALDSVEDEAKGLEIGAIDYVTKPISPAIVRARVHNHLELKRARDLLEQLSITDALTGLANRRRFDAVLAAEIERQRRSGESLSLVLLDVDHFKHYNDTYGHPAGDDCLRAVASVIDTMVGRAVDTAARYGGEEFAFILPNTCLDGAKALAEGIRAGVAALNILHRASSAANHVTLSAGVASSPDTPPAQLIAQADECLYRAKALGRNRIIGPYGRGI